MGKVWGKAEVLPARNVMGPHSGPPESQLLQSAANTKYVALGPPERGPCSPRPRNSRVPLEVWAPAAELLDLQPAVEAGGGMAAQEEDRE